MTSKLFAAVMVLCVISYASASTTAIGTINAHGDIRVDGYAVKGNATLFDGTAVETGQASAAIRLKTGVEIKLATNSCGTLYNDGLVLQCGSSELQLFKATQLEVNGLRMTPGEPNSKSLVSIDGAKNMEIAALTGTFRVTNGKGILLAEVSPGNAHTFAVPQITESQIPNAATPKGPIKMTLFGDLTRIGDHYYLNLPTPDLGYTYEVQGSNLDHFIGKRVVISGMVYVQMKPVGKADYVLVAQSVSEEHISNPMSMRAKAILASLILGGAAGAAIGTYEANQSPTPASR